MATFNPIYNGRVDNAGAADPHRGLTPELWRGVNFYNQNPEHSLSYFDDFKVLPNVIATQATAGTFALATAEANVALADSNSTTADQGINVQFPGLGITPAAPDVICFEARVKLADIGGGIATNGANVIFGLHDADTTALAAGVPSGNDYALFHALASANTGTALALEVAVTGTGDPQAGVHTVVDGTYFRAGFRMKVGEGIRCWIDGVETSTANIASANFPNALVVPTFACHSEGTVDPILHIDWFAVGVADGADL